jgi:hypothetical protein
VNQLVIHSSSPAVPVLVAAAGERAGMRFLEFFAANIRNPHTRRAYARAADEFLSWCADAGVSSIAAVQPVQAGARLCRLQCAVDGSLEFAVELEGLVVSERQKLG